MGIVEAVKSGKPFKRRNWVSYALTLSAGCNFENDGNTLSNADIFATDWEIKEGPFTGEDIKSALHDMEFSLAQSGRWENALRDFKKRLGL